MTPVPRHGYTVGLPPAGRWREMVNSDAADYGGCGVGNLRMGHGERYALARASGLGESPCRRWPRSISDPGTSESKRVRKVQTTDLEEKHPMRLSAPSDVSMAYVLAGGRGSRLLELTERRAKPAVYFGGKARIIDFALSNAINSGIRRIGVATQYKAHCLIRHLQQGWNFLRPERNESFDILPASQRVSENQWYEGTADAVFQNIDIIATARPEYMVILAGDHIYKMDYELMLQQHVGPGADVTVGCLEVPRRKRPASASCRSTPTTDPRFRREAGRPAGDAGHPDKCAGLDGHLCLRHQIPVRPARRDADESELEPRFRQGRHSLAGQERQGGGAPFL